MDVFFFELELDSKTVSLVLFYDLMNSVNLKTTPKLFEGSFKNFLNGDTLEKASTNSSVLNAKILREGIVIRPYYETNILGFGRAILKQRSPEYLVNSDL